MKHSVPKGDKKKKKEITLEIAKLEEELNDRHKKELELLEKEPQVRRWHVTFQGIQCVYNGNTMRDIMPFISGVWMKKA